MYDPGRHGSGGPVGVARLATASAACAARWRPATGFHPGGRLPEARIASTAFAGPAAGGRSTSSLWVERLPLLAACVRAVLAAGSWLRDAFGCAWLHVVARFEATPASAAALRPAAPCDFCDAPQSTHGERNVHPEFFFVLTGCNYSTYENGMSLEVGGKFGDQKEFRGGKRGPFSWSPSLSVKPREMPAKFHRSDRKAARLPRGSRFAGIVQTPVRIGEPVRSQGRRDR